MAACISAAGAEELSVALPHCHSQAYKIALLTGPVGPARSVSDER